MELLLPDSVLAVWHHVAQDASRVAVFPDGCRDLIVHATAGGPPRWFVSALMDSVQHTQSQSGEVWIGFRLRPGVVIDEAKLLSAVAEVAPDEAIRSLEQLDMCCRIDARLSDALFALSHHEEVTVAARSVGVSVRTLERYVRRNSQRTPAYWKQLARVRRAALALSGDQPLAEIAAAYGFADQAHMSREFRRWFQRSPKQLRREPSLLRIVQAPGYA